MAPTPCSICQTTRATIIRPKNGSKICKTCFFDVFESEIHETITSNSLFVPGERVAIGASGGKDSTVLASILRLLNERHSYGLDLVLLSVDEGIRGYRDDSLETVKRNSAQYNLPLEIVSYDSLYGWTMDQVVDQVGKKGNCTYCGVFRRQALDRGAAKLGIKHLVTGHNADDIAETVMMNLLRGDLPRLARATSIVTESAVSEVKRSKPLKYAYEKEIVLYALHKGLDYFSTECIYSPEAFRGSARTLIKNLERIRPSSILDTVRSGEEMAKLVPVEVTGGDGGGGGTVKDVRVVVVDEDEGGSMGGCGESNNGGTPGEMAAMEARLRAANEQQTTPSPSEAREIDFTSVGLSKIKTCAGKSKQSSSSPSSTTHSNKTSGQNKENGNVKKLPKQRMGKCSRCGYISSQAVCKACVLLEGLNKNRPKMEVQVSVEEEESSPTLTRRMEGLNVDAG